MSISAVTTTALSGMQAQATRIAATASNIANAGTAGALRLSTQFTALPSTGPASGGVTASVYAKPIDAGPISPEPLSDASLPGAGFGRDMTDLISASLEFKANAIVFDTGADLWDLLASIRRD